MKTKMLSAAEVSVFCEQIALILNGGIPLYEGTYILYQEMENIQLKELMKQIDEAVKDNIPFYQALDRTKAFPEYMIHMVEIGETTGKLEDVMQSLAEYYDREHNIKTSVRNVISYPIMLFAMMGIILVVLVTKILPMFEQVFLELDSEVGASSKDMMNVSLTMGRVVAVLVGIVFLIIVFLLLWSRTKRGRDALYQFCNVSPFTRKIATKMAIGKFVSSMSLMISSGLENDQSLELAAQVVRQPKIHKKIEKSRNLLAEKKTFDESLKETGLLTGMHGRMVSVGAKTGVLDVVFAKLSRKFDEEIEAMLGGIATIVETSLVISLSLVVGVVLISVMLPLVSIISSIG